MQRRTFLKSALASLPLLAGSKVAWAKEGGLELAGHTDSSHLKGEYFLAGKDQFSGHKAYIVGSDFEIKRQIELPNRFHGQARSNDGHLAIFSRRPLDHLCLIRPNGDVDIKQCQDDRHFFGHGAFSLDSRLLYTSENLFDHEDSDQTGRIGVWDVKRAELISDFWSGGIGPHQIMLSRNGQYLVVANGGILTHPDFPRKKLNLDEMQANIAIIQAKTGKIEKRLVLPKELHQLSMRHIDVNAKGEIVIAMQYQGKRQDQVPLIATITKEMKLSFAQMDVGAIAAHQQYIGSICYDRSGGYFAATSPRGNIVSFYDRSGSYLTQLKMDDVCAISQNEHNASFNVTNGMGVFMTVLLQNNAKNSSLFETKIVKKMQLKPKWDNHMSMI